MGCGVEIDINFSKILNNDGKITRLAQNPGEMVLIVMIVILSR